MIAGVVPHRLADDIEEERRVLHVGITRARHRAAVLTDRTRPSPFLAELAGTAPHRPPPRPGDGRVAGAAGETVTRAPRRASASSAAVADGIVAAEGQVLRVLGGYEGVIEEATGAGVQVRLESGGTLSVRYGERVEQRGRTAPLAPPVDLWGGAADAESALRRWRATRAKADGKPAYVVLSDAHLRGIALARPTDAAALLACDGIGPTKLDRYGDEILSVLDA